MNNLQAAHPNPDQLQAYGLGRLAPEDSAEIEHHVGGCEACCHVLKGLADDTFVSLTRAAATLAATPAPPSAQVPGPNGTAVPVTVSPEPRKGEATGVYTPKEGATSPDETTALSARPGVPEGLIDHPRYRVLDLLGAGGMGTVYKAEHRLMHRLVALKIIRRALVERPGMVERFQREVEAAARLSHPHIVTAHDAECAGDTHFLVMEYVEGTSLDRLVLEGGPLPAAEACDYARQAALGLQHAFEKGMVHRDIKPQNLMLTPQGQVKVLDFGLARLASEAAPAGALTELGSVMGTPDYIAPEQARDPHAADTRADVYSLGCTLYYLLVGHPPFPGGDFMSKLTGHLERTPSSLAELRSGLSRQLVRVVERMMAKDPGQRYQVPAEVVQALTPFAHPAPAQPPRRRTWPAVAAAVLLAVLGLAGCLFGPAVFRIATDRGQLVVEVDDPDVEVLIQKGGATIRDQAAGRTYLLKPGDQDLKAGDYELQVTEEASGLQFSTRAFTIKRGDKFPVKVTLERAPAGPVAEIKDFPPSVTIQPEPLPDLAAGSPLSQLALVHRPAHLDGVRAWTAETRGHRGMVQVLAYRPDGRRLASAGEDGTVRLWEAGTGRLVRALVGHGGAVRSAAWSPDGKVLASGGLDWTVKFWAADTGRLDRTLHEPGGEVNSMAWSPDGQTLATANSTPTLRLWDVASGKVRDTLRGHAAWINAVAWSPDGQLLASASNDKTVCLWTPGSGKLVHTLAGHIGEVSSLAWSPDSRILASGGWDNRVLLWDAGAGNLLRPLQEGLPVATLAWSPDGKILATGSHDTVIRMWAPDTGKRLTLLHGHRGVVAALAWSPDGGTLASGSDDSTVRLWEPDAPRERLVIEGHKRVRALAWSPEGKSLVVGADDKIRLWDAGSGLPARSLQAVPGGQSFAWSPDGKTIASGRWDQTVRLWTVESGLLARTLEGHAGRVNAVAWSPDGKTLAAGSTDGGARLWDLGTGKLLHTLRAEGVRVLSMAWSPDNTTLACGYDNFTVRLWEVKSGQMLRLLEGHDGWVLGVAWSPDGKTLASGSTDGGARLWDPGTGKLLKTLRGDRGGVLVAWLSGGKTLATIGDNRVQFWDVKSGEAVRNLPGAVSSGVFSPDGGLLASPGASTVRLWEVESGRLRWALVGLADDQPVTFTADGHHSILPGIERQLVYIVENDQGQEIMTPEEFARRYDWKNDPERVGQEPRPPWPPAQEPRPLWPAPVREEFATSVGMKLRLIPAGAFVMGSPATEAGHTDEEHAHRVRITRPFYVGVYEVTQGEYRRVTGGNPSWFSPTGEGKDRVAAWKATGSRWRAFPGTTRWPSAACCRNCPTRRPRAASTVCPPRPNGSTPAGPGQGRRSTAATPCRPRMPTSTGAARTARPTGAPASTGRLPSAPTPLMPGACMTCTAMSGSGVRTATS